jgi:hypothetical protein
MNGPEQKSHFIELQAYWINSTRSVMLSVCLSTSATGQQLADVRTLTRLTESPCYQHLNLWALINVNMNPLYHLKNMASLPVDSLSYYRSPLSSECTYRTQVSN